MFWIYLVKKCQRVQYERIRGEDSEFQIHVLQKVLRNTFYGPTSKSFFRVRPTGLFRSMKSTLSCIIRELYIHTRKKKFYPTALGRRRSTCTQILVKVAMTADRVRIVCMFHIPQTFPKMYQQNRTSKHNTRQIRTKQNRTSNRTFPNMNCRGTKHNTTK